MIIKINNQNTPYTIDMYQIFNGDNETEQAIEYYNDNNNSNHDYDDFDWNFDTVAIREQLAAASLKYLNDNTLDDVILSIESEGSYSPKFYNYQTDSYSMSLEISLDNLNLFINGNKKEYNNWKDNQTYWIEENDIDSFLLYYIESKKDDNDDYLYHMHEIANEFWSENTTMTLINK